VSAAFAALGRVFLCLDAKFRVIHASELPLEILHAEPITGSFGERVAAYERTLLLTALKDARGNQRAAAERLGMSYDQLRHYYKKYRLGDLLG